MSGPSEISTSATTNGKTATRRPGSLEHLVQVQPARVEDLQPRYAQQIQHDDDNPDAHGWYAGFSEY
jgi:hypothetical protein